MIFDFGKQNQEYCFFFANDATDVSERSDKAGELGD